MKRILSILLVLIMLLSFAACASDNGSDGANSDTSSGTNTDSDTGANTNTNTSTNTNTNTSTNTGGSSYVPDYTKDTTNYNPRTNIAKTAIYYINETLEYPTVTKYKNGAKAALSMTFDEAVTAESEVGHSLVQNVSSTLTKFTSTYQTNYILLREIFFPNYNLRRLYL